ncbi:MAG: hypothetical protein WC763_02645 [Candidatus Paceibacterota bacterium]|jgi:hypothetical protein
MLLKRTSLIVVSLGLFLSCSFVSAQSIPGIQNPLVVSVVPTEPRANQAVFINVQSYSTDLNKALITWSVDGKAQASGVGLKDFNLMAGPSGSTKVVDISVATIGSGVLSDSVIIRPADVGLLWEADTYTPPFYQGKALHSYNGSFKVTALPELFTSAGTKIASKDLIYTWKKNGLVQGDVSGYGRNSYIGSQTSYLREGEDISVEVSAPRDNVVATNDILITPTVPEVLLYENSPLYGIVYEKALRNSTGLTNEEISIVAEPFFFSVSERNNGNLTYAWKLNDSTISDFANKSEITLRKVEGMAAGRASLGIVVQHTNKLLQGGKSSLIISYE